MSSRYSVPLRKDRTGKDWGIINRINKAGRKVDQKTSHTLRGNILREQSRHLKH